MKQSEEADTEKVAPPEYTIGETIEQLAGWRRGEPMYPIEVALSAVHWMTGRAQPIGTRGPMSFGATLGALNGWLADETPELPESVALATLYWLRQLYELDSRTESRP